MIRFLVLSLTFLASVEAWSSTSSAFGGRMLVGAQNGSNLDMKKGKANVPPQMRGQYKKQQEMAEMRRQIVEASQPGSDGLPVFNLYVRTKRQNVRILLLRYQCSYFVVVMENYVTNCVSNCVSHCLTLPSDLVSMW